MLAFLSNLPERFLHAHRLYKRSNGRYLRHAAIKPPFIFFVDGEPFFIESEDNESSRSCYCEVIIDDVYGLTTWKPKKTAPLIVDIGSNIGTFSSFAKSLFKESRVVAFEPHPLVLPWLKKNALVHNFHVEPVAVSERAYIAKLNASTATTCAQLDAADGYDVNVIGPESVVPGETIDLLKLDCEGAEHEVLQDGSLLKRTNSIRMEYHADTLEKNKALFKNIEDHGFTITLLKPFKIARELLGILHAEKK